MGFSSKQLPTATELLGLALSPYAAETYSPLTGQPFLLADLSAGEVPDAAQQLAIANWLQRLPCPTIAITGVSGGYNRTDGGHGPLHAAFDTTVADNAEAEILTAIIAQAPIAAMTLVQVLRNTETMPAAQALLVESLAYSTLQAGPEFRRWLAQHPAPPPSAAVDTGPALILRRDGATLQLTLNRPARRNAISVEMRDALVEALQLAVTDRSIDRIEINGNGACFSIGGDLDEFGLAPDPATAHAIRSQQLPAAVLVQCAERTHFYLHSACIGAGMEIPAFGAHVSASKKTFFQLPELRFGLIPGAGGCISLPRRIGRQRTAWLALAARKINAATALEWGLIDTLTE